MTFFEFILLSIILGKEKKKREKKQKEARSRGLLLFKLLRGSQWGREKKSERKKGSKHQLLIATSETPCCSDGA